MYGICVWFVKELTVLINLAHHHCCCCCRSVIVTWSRKKIYFAFLHSSPLHIDWRLQMENELELILTIWNCQSHVINLAFIMHLHQHAHIRKLILLGWAREWDSKKRSINYYFARTTWRLSLDTSFSCMSE